MTTQTTPRQEEAFDPAPLDRCAECGRPLNPFSRSLWFCTFLGGDASCVGLWSPCQLLWHSRRAGVNLQEDESTAYAYRMVHGANQQEGTP